MASPKYMKIHKLFCTNSKLTGSTCTNPTSLVTLIFIGGDVSAWKVRDRNPC